MRTDELGNECPETLGEYRDLCAVLLGEDSRAVQFLDSKIAEQGRGSRIVVPDSQVRGLLFSLHLGAT